MITYNAVDFYKKISIVTFSQKRFGLSVHFGQPTHMALLPYLLLQAPDYERYPLDLQLEGQFQKILMATSLIMK